MQTFPKVKGESEVVIWGTGRPRREFLYVDDMAAASVFVMQLSPQSYQDHTQPMQSHVNVGFGSDVTIAELAQAVGKAVGFSGAITQDSSKPDGAPRKWMSSQRMNHLGWRPKVTLRHGLGLAYEDFVNSISI